MIDNCFVLLFACLLQHKAILNVEKAFENGFDNYSTVRGDPDLDPIKKEPAFEKLMEKYDGNNGFNPFGFFTKK
jgi:hypothetical protein